MYIRYSFLDGTEAKNYSSAYVSAVRLYPNWCLLDPSRVSSLSANLIVFAVTIWLHSSSKGQMMAENLPPFYRRQKVDWSILKKTAS